jgi:hypothetical protein
MNIHSAKRWNKKLSKRSLADESEKKTTEDSQADDSSAKDTETRRMSHVNKESADSQESDSNSKTDEEKEEESAKTKVVSQKSNILLRRRLNYMQSLYSKFPDAGHDNKKAHHPRAALQKSHAETTPAPEADAEKQSQEENSTNTKVNAAQAGGQQVQPKMNYHTPMPTQSYDAKRNATRNLFPNLQANEFDEYIGRRLAGDEDKKDKKKKEDCNKECADKNLKGTEENDKCRSDCQSQADKDNKAKDSEHSAVGRR